MHHVFRNYVSPFLDNHWIQIKMRHSQIQIFIPVTRFSVEVRDYPPALDLQRRIKERYRDSTLYFREFD